VTAAAEFFAALPERLSARGDDMGGAVVAFALAGAPHGGWTLRFGPGGPELDRGVAAADVTVTCQNDVWEQLLERAVEPQTAWATGLLTVTGDMRLAQRLRSLLEF
jgi:hypothetical protein